MRFVVAISDEDRARAHDLDDELTKHEERVRERFARMLLATDPREIDWLVERLRQDLHTRAAHQTLVRLFLLECPGGLQVMLQRREQDASAQLFNAYLNTLTWVPGEPEVPR